MALISTLGSVLTLNWRDNNAKSSNQSFYLPPAANTLALALTRASALRDAILPLTTARLLGGMISFPLTEDNPGSGGTDPSSEVERKLVTNWVGANRRQTFKSELPSVIFDLEVPLTDVIDTLDPLFLAYSAAVIANAVTNRGEALTAINGPVYIDHRNRRRV